MDKRRKRRTGSPDFLVVDDSKLLGEVFTVGGATVELEGFPGLGAVLYALVQLLKDGDVSLFENGGPVKSATASCCGACVVHVVHTRSKLLHQQGNNGKRWENILPLLSDQRVQGLCGFFDGLVESFRRRVSVFAENLVLSKEEALCRNTSEHRMREV